MATTTSSSPSRPLTVTCPDGTPADIRQAAARVVALVEGTHDYDVIKDRVSKFEFRGSVFLDLLVEVALNRPLTREDENAVWSLRWSV